MTEGLEEAIERVLERRLDIIERVILKHPEIVYDALMKLAPWKDLVTKKDLETAVSELKGVMATKDDLEAIRRVMATKDDLKAMATKDDLEAIRRVMATKDDLEKLKIATKEDLKRLEVRLTNMISALGARWGVVNESVYREGIKEILSEIGWRVEHVVITDVDGYVYGRPEEVEIDIVVSDNRVFLVEITAAVRRSDIDLVAKKAELYRRVKGVKPDRVMIISPFIHDKNPERIRAIASEMGIEIIYPRVEE